MRDELRRLQLPRLHELEQHRDRRRVHEPRRNRDIAIPEFLEMQLHRLAVDADVRQAAARRENRLTDVERRGNADRLDRDVHAGTVGQRHDLIDGGAVRAVDQRGRARIVRRLAADWRRGRSSESPRVNRTARSAARPVRSDPRRRSPPCHLAAPCRSARRTRRRSAECR